MAKQLTIRGVSAELDGRLHDLCEAQGKSLNAVVLEILSSVAGIDNKRRKQLERYVTWTREEGESFDEVVRSQRTIDDNLWK